MHADPRTELARLKAATPSTIPSFQARREEQIKALEVLVAKMGPVTEAPVRDAALEAVIEKYDASSPANRRADRWR
jgi:hypothetical protein